jgi:hypothetical protein
MVIFLLVFPDHLWQLVPDIVMVLIAEVLVDWLKHAFIVKFNDISSDVSLHASFTGGRNDLKQILNILTMLASCIM